VGDFGEDLDAVKRRFVELDKPAPATRVEIIAANKGASHARMTNTGAPILAQPTSAPGFHTAPSSPKEGEETTKTTAHEDYVVRPRRHDFPRFSGDKPLLWVDLCLTYFAM
jgi:hypothetical protein